MAYAKKRNSKKTTTSKKRNTRRTPYKRRATTQIATTRPTVQRGYLPFGTKFYAKLPWCYNGNFTVGSNGLTDVPIRISLNSMFQPHHNVTDTQPLQYDVMALHYERVWVYGAKVTITFSDPSTDGISVGYRVRANTNSVSTAGRAFTHIQELRDSKWRNIHNTGNQSARFTFYAQNHNVIGIDKKQYSNLEYSHTTGANPAVFSWLEPFAFNKNTSGDIIYNLNIKVTYYGMFTNPISEMQN